MKKILVVDNNIEIQDLISKYFTARTLNTSLLQRMEK